MNDLIVNILVIVAAIGAGLMAGLYYAFSAFIMKSFDQIGASNAVVAMNSINEVILRSSFMLLFFGSTILFALLAVLGFFQETAGNGWLLIAAGLIYVIGMFVCTAAINVPLNNQLAAVGNDGQAQIESWNHYYLVWTRWNSLRAFCSLVASVLCVIYLTFNV